MKRCRFCLVCRKDNYFDFRWYWTKTDLFHAADYFCLFYDSVSCEVMSDCGYEVLNYDPIPCFFYDDFTCGNFAPHDGKGGFCRDSKPIIIGG